MKVNIDRPANWQDFEDLCLQLWKDIWGDANAQKNGRSGQKQHGVDVYGYSTYDGLLHGVQCKGKNGNYGSILEKKELIKEANNAEKFVPKLASFTMATTSPRDAELQKECRIMNDSNVHEYTVNVWSWDDIEDELQYRSDILKHFKIDFDDQEMDTSSIKINQVTKGERLQAFMSRPILKAVTSYSMNILLYHVFYEIMLNAFIHGGATLCVLLYENYRFTIMTDGNKFNPEDLINIQGDGGAITFRRLFKKCGDGIKTNYEYKEEEGKPCNIYSLYFDPKVLKRDIDKREISVNRGFAIQSRTEAERLAMNDLTGVSDTEEVIVVFGNIVAYSCIGSYSRKASQILGRNRLSISLSKSQEDYADHLKDYANEITIR